MCFYVDRSRQKRWRNLYVYKALQKFIYEEKGKELIFYRSPTAIRPLEYCLGKKTVADHKQSEPYLFCASFPQTAKGIYVYKGKKTDSILSLLYPPSGYAWVRLPANIKGDIDTSKLVYSRYVFVMVKCRVEPKDFLYHSNCGSMATYKKVIPVGEVRT